MRSARSLMRERFELLGVSLVIAAFLVRRLDWVRAPEFLTKLRLHPYYFMVIT
jgi:hypothetical protein